MKYFSGFKEYANFALAREFIYADSSKGNFKHSPNTLEKLGSFLVAPLFNPADKIMKNMNNPVVIVAVTTAGLFAATLAFYPATIVHIIDHVWVLHMASFALSQSAILGIGLRTLGRLSQDCALMQAWKRQELIPLPLGSELIR